QLLFTALVILVSGIAVMVLSIVIGWLVYGVNLTDMQNMVQDASDPKNISILKFFQTFQSIGVFIIPPFIVAWFLHDRPSVFLQYDRKPDLRSILFVIGIVYFSNPLINWLTEINASLSLPDWMNSVETWMQDSENQADQITEAFLSTTSITTLFTNIVMIGILPAVGEELLFRGIIQQLFKKKFGNAHAAIWISAAIFSALHMQFFGFLPRLVLGAMFGYMLEWSGTLWLPVIAHFVNNTTAVIGYYLMNKGLIGSGLDKTGTWSDGSFYMVIVSAVFLFAFFRALYLRRDTRPASLSENKLL
ncbi:MAG TPA: CPBP family intramembrane glutamic endopeptidase, partial [Prolixibacteraceae bacterium]